MQRRTLIQTLGLAGMAGTTAAATPRVQQGRLERWARFESRHVDARPVEVWLPPGYGTDARRYAVLYMHDGQMLFDPASTWNGQAWQVDQVAAPLLARGQLRDFIVVGPWNNGPLRHAEYFPQGFLAHLHPDDLRQRHVKETLHGRPLADAYLRFLVEELKPAVDARFATHTGRDATFLMGSSMGGLISAYGLCEYPQVFGGAACLSTHWIGTRERNEAFPSAALAYLRHKLPTPEQVWLYMDRGTEELDAQYDTAQPRIDALLTELGYRAPRFVSRVFEGTGHNERAWSARLQLPLTHLLASR